MRLTPEEKEMLRLYEASRPAGKQEKKKSAKNKKTANQWYKKPEFYAGAFMVLAVVSGVSLAVFAVAIEQVTDVDMLISVTQEDAPQELLDASGGGYSQWIDIVVFLRENIVSAILGVVGFFALIAFAVMFIGNLYKKNKENKKSDEVTSA